jgi:hypothetical protein
MTTTIITIDEATGKQTVGVNTRRNCIILGKVTNPFDDNGCCNLKKKCEQRHKCSVCEKPLHKVNRRGVINAVSYAGVGFCHSCAIGRCNDFHIYQTIGILSLPPPELLEVPRRVQSSLKIAATLEYDIDCYHAEVDGTAQLKFNLFTMAYGSGRGKGKHMAVPNDVMRMIFDHLVAGVQSNPISERGDIKSRFLAAAETQKNSNVDLNATTGLDAHPSNRLCSSDVPICLDCKKHVEEPTSQHVHPQMPYIRGLIGGYTTSFHYLGQDILDKNPGLTLCETCEPMVKTAIVDDMLAVDPTTSVFRSLNKVNPVRVERGANHTIIMDPRLGYMKSIHNITRRYPSLTEWIIGIQLMKHRKQTLEQSQDRVNQDFYTQLTKYTTTATKK